MMEGRVIAGHLAIQSLLLEPADGDGDDDDDGEVEIA